MRKGILGRSWLYTLLLVVLMLSALAERKQKQHLIRTGIALIASAFLTAFLLTAVNHEPPLPPVAVSGDVNVEGRLLGHTDGFWYVYGREDGRGRELIAIPDNEVKTTRVQVESK